MFNKIYKKAIHWKLSLCHKREKLAIDTKTVPAWYSSSVSNLHSFFFLLANSCSAHNSSSMEVCEETLPCSLTWVDTFPDFFMGSSGCLKSSLNTAGHLDFVNYGPHLSQKGI